MTKWKKLLCFVLSFVFAVNIIIGIHINALAIAFNEVAGPHAAGDLTGYIYGDLVTEGELDGYGMVQPWSSFSWLEDGETITLAYSGVKMSSEGTGLEDLGSYGYAGTADLASGNVDPLNLLLDGATKDVRVYFFNTTENDVNVSFDIQSISKAAFSYHSVASVTTPDGTTMLDDANPEAPEENYNRSANYSFTLTPYEGTPPEAYGGDSGDQESLRPADAEDGKAPAGCFYITLVTHPHIGADPAAGVIISNFFAAAESGTLAEITLQAPAYGSYTATAVVPDGEGGTTISTATVTAGDEDVSFSYLPANGFTLDASGNDSYAFDYWTTTGATPRIYSYESSFTTRSYTNGSTVVAAFLPKEQVRAFDVGGTRYVSWVDAVQAAQSTDSIITLAKDYTFAATEAEVTAKGDVLTAGILESSSGGINYIIPEGVKFLVPFSAQDAGTFNDGPGFSVAAVAGAYRTLTVPSAVRLTVNGNLNVNALAYARGTFMGGATEKYGFIDLDGTLDVNGELRTFGYIAGNGTVNVNPGGTSYEVLQMADWGGGSGANTWKNGAGEYSKKGGFYFSQYYVQNVEANYRVYTGANAKVYGHLSVVYEGMKMSANVPCGFIGEGDTLFTMANGYIERSYNAATDRVTYDVHGDMQAKAITVDVMNLATVASENWLLGLTNNMDIIVSSGTSTLNYNYMVLPETRIVVQEGAKIVAAPSAKVVIWRLDDWISGFAGGTSHVKMVPIRYTVANGTTPVRTTLQHSGVLELYGTVEASSNIFTTNNGGAADDMVIRGTGTFINHDGTTNGEVYMPVANVETVNGSTVVAINWTPVATEPLLAYMYGETEVSSFEPGTYYSKVPTVDTHGNGTYDSWYQWQVDYTLVDQNNETISYTDFASNSEIDLYGSLIADDVRYVITGVDSIQDAEGNDLSGTVTYDGNITVGGLAVNKNTDVAEGWEAIQFHGLAQNIKVQLHVQAYDHRVVWNETLEDESLKSTASYVVGESATYEWDHVYAVEAAVVPADGATAAVVSNSTRTVLNLTDISKDVEVNITASTDYHPVAVLVTYPNGTSEEYSIYSTKADGIWSATFTAPTAESGYYVISDVTLTNGASVGVKNNQDSLILTGIVTDNVTVNVTLEHKDFKITYNTTLANAEGSVSLAPSFVDAAIPITVSNTAISGAENVNYVFGDAAIATSGTTAALTATPTSLVLTGINQDLTVNVPVSYYDYIVTADGQTAYAVSGGEVTFTLEAGYALNDATIPSNQIGEIVYTNPAMPEGAATITVSGIGSDVDVTVDKVHFDAIVTFKDTADNVLATKYYGTGSTITYTAVDEGVGGNRFFVADATSTGATVTRTTQTVSVTDVIGDAADVIVTLTPFTYKVTWNDGVQTTYTYLTGAENEATYTPRDEGVGGARYIIKTGYGDHALDATNSYPSTNGKTQFTVANINADEVVTLTLNTFTYKIVFTDQNDNVLKTQYADAEGKDVTIGVGDNAIRYDVAGLDLISDKNTIITACNITGTATVNDGGAFGEGVRRVTLTEIGSDVTAKLEVYEYKYKLYVVLNDLNGWSSTTEVHYVAGDSYDWTRPDGETYEVESVRASYGTAKKNSVSSVSLDLSGVSEVNVEMAITTKRTEVLLKTDLSQFTNATSSADAKIVVTDGVYGTFTVECDVPCVAAVDNGDGTYARLTAIPTDSTTTYEFKLDPNFPVDIHLVIAVKGDVSGDGYVTASDQTLIARAQLLPSHKRYRPLTGLALFLADTDENGFFTPSDETRIARALLMSTHRRYLAFKW